MAYFRTDTRRELTVTQQEDRPRIAKLFDAIDGERVDFSQRDLLADGNEKTAILEYLDKAEMLLRTTARASDHLDPTKGKAVPMSFRSDGQWVWSEGVGYYLKNHGVAPEKAFLDYLRGRDYSYTSPNKEQLDNALTALQEKRRSRP